MEYGGEGKVVNKSRIENWESRTEMLKTRVRDAVRCDAVRWRRDVRRLDAH